MAVKALEPGGDADFGIGLFNGTDGTPLPTASSTIVHGSHKRSITYDRTNSNTSDVRFNGVTSDVGGRISIYLYFTTLPGAATDGLLATAKSTTMTNVVNVRISSAGVLTLNIGGTNVQIGSNGATLSTGNWYRICLCWTITSSTVNQFRLFVSPAGGGAGTLSVTGSNVTLTNTIGTDIRIGNLSGDTSEILYTSDHYVDDSTSLSDTGDIWVTSKRSFANGTTNGFTTQIGSGGSGYGTGHAPQVNERPLSLTNGWSMVGVGSAITEEYTIEGASVGDVDISTATIVDFVGWVDVKALIAETASIIVGGASSNISVTTSAAIFTKVAGSTTYPVGGTDIGVVTSTTVTTFSLYECGVLFAYIPAVAPSINTGTTFLMMGI